ncbi:unnamed protein product [Moneuplotes crassus]|uniref:Uncharacterized protein n=1 Tax=Euplotes crassus TaxID=5936 RepID=A0AAD1UJH8_EUPCR|nr:unnamed protein product [Moneuplotes crassus]
MAQNRGIGGTHSRDREDIYSLQRLISNKIKLDKPSYCCRKTYCADCAHKYYIRC